jgi:hypothetical protein
MVRNTDNVWQNFADDLYALSTLQTVFQHLIKVLSIVALPDHSFQKQRSISVDVSAIQEVRLTPQWLQLGHSCVEA